MSDLPPLDSSSLQNANSSSDSSDDAEVVVAVAEEAEVVVAVEEEADVVVAEETAVLAAAAAAPLAAGADRERLGGRCRGRRSFAFFGGGL